MQAAGLIHRKGNRDKLCSSRMQAAAGLIHRYASRAARFKLDQACHEHDTIGVEPSMHATRHEVSSSLSSAFDAPSHGILTLLTRHEWQYPAYSLGLRGCATGILAITAPPPPPFVLSDPSKSNR